MATFRIPPNWRELDAVASAQRGEPTGWVRCACGCGQHLREIDDRGRRCRFVYRHVGRPGGWPRWTVRDDDRLLTLWERSLPDHEIARILRRTKDAVVARRAVILARLGRGDQLYTRDVAAIFGVTNTTVRAWIGRGWLRADRSGWLRTGRRGGTYRAWWCTYADAEAFLRDERYWMRWWPEDVTDPRWSAIVEDARSGVRFLGTEEVGRRLGYAPTYVVKLIHRGRLRAVRGCTRNDDGLKCSRSWWIREDWLPGRAS